MQSANMQQDE